MFPIEDGHKKTLVQHRNWKKDPLAFAEFKQSFDKKECPICKFCADCLGRFYYWFILETYYNPSMMEKLQKAYGFCQEHTWKLIEASSPYITGVMYEYLTRSTKLNLEKLLEEIRGDDGRKRRRGWLWRKNHRKECQKILKAATRPSVCPACENIAWSSRYAMEQLLEHLKETETRDLYRKSGGLCLHHFLQILPLGDEPEAIFLLEDQIGRAQGLHEELKEFLRKYAYQYHHEPKGSEQSSWVRAAEFFAGRKYDPVDLWKRDRGVLHIF